MRLAQTNVYTSVSPQKEFTYGFLKFKQDWILYRGMCFEKGFQKIKEIDHVSMVAKSAPDSIFSGNYEPP